MTMKKWIISVAILASLHVGAENIEGNYANEKGTVVFKLQNNKLVFADKNGNFIKVQMSPSLPPMEMGFPYKIEGKNLVVYGPHADDKYEVLPGGKLRSLINGDISTKK
jgi:hypothetical protein